jgi:glycosyltransferase involved in cell wall biosynthesis
MAMVSICLLGDFSENLDEGYKNTSHYLSRGLERHNSVVRLNGKRVGTVEFWRGVIRASPHILHAIGQPTYQSLIFVSLLRRLWPKAHTAVSTLRAERFFPNGEIKHSHRWVMRLARPDLVLVQTPEDAALFNQLGCQVALLPNGVDLEQFRPATQECKRELRRQYGLNPDWPVVLHVGHLEEARNLLALRELPKAQIQVLVAGSIYMGIDHDLIEQLENAGFHILKGYQAHIEELYMLADCYVFPPRPGSSLTMPLSVLEAMACNLPVISTPFHGLTHAFTDGNGLRFVENTDDLLPHVQEVLASPDPPATREMVSEYSWQAVVDQLEVYYQGLLDR